MCTRGFILLVARKSTDDLKVVRGIKNQLIHISIILRSDCHIFEVIDSNPG